MATSGKGYNFSSSNASLKRGFEILDPGYWIQDARHRILDAGSISKK
jgi:hypothetical protein